MSKKAIALLGFEVEDRVTGFTGVVTAMSFDLFGCIQAVVQQPVKEGKKQESSWFDVARLRVTSKRAVMPLPDFDKVPPAEWDHGPTEKPSFNRHS